MPPPWPWPRSRHLSLRRRRLSPGKSRVSGVVQGVAFTASETQPSHAHLQPVLCRGWASWWRDRHLSIHWGCVWFGADVRGAALSLRYRLLCGPELSFPEGEHSGGTPASQVRCLTPRAAVSRQHPLSSLAVLAITRILYFSRCLMDFIAFLEWLTMLTNLSCIYEP